ncbi:MAG: radical SAM protein [Anaerolineaceae bacterium]|nr:radical SAM protein [Anaerolineaceae bacterium]
MPITLKANGSNKGVRTPVDKLRPEPGLYHFEIKDDSEKSRIHLRIDPDERGVLMINASRVVQLNPTAAQMAYMILKKTPSRQAVRHFTKQFNVSHQQAKQDYELIASQLDALIPENGACPVCELNLESTSPFSARPSAPYRMDLALTYRCNNACLHCYNARSRSYPELDTQAWKRVIDKLWDLRIPHLVFTGGEPTLRDDMPELIAYAEGKGQITGINTNGRRLADQTFLKSLVDAGLDHVQITFESHDPLIHDLMVASTGAWNETLAGLRNVVKSSLYMMTNTTLLTHNSPYLEETLNFLADEGVPTIGLNALIYAGRGENVDSGLAEATLPPLLEIARRITDTRGQRLIWYTPTQYCHFNPLQLQLGIKGCTAALYNMCVEPDGAVLPCQSYYQSLGNILDDPWVSIWEHPISVSIRERRDIPDGCQSCDFLVECGGGCPLAREYQSIYPVKNEVFI